MNLPEQKPCILIVDDEPANISILEHLFKGEYRTRSASDGQVALDVLSEDDAEFDLVLLDIMMPRLSGLDVLREIRANPSTSDIPVILISARMDEVDIVQGLSIGANDYITKPFRLAELRARARTQITLKRLQDERTQTINELRAAHDLKDRFFRIASHDLKGPLGNLRLVHYLMRQQMADDHEAVDLLDTADANVTTMQSVINEFLDLSALQSGKIDLHPKAVDAETLIRDLLNQYRMNAMKKKISFDVSQIQGTIYGDGARLGQALGNLISNALKYSPPDACVTIWTETRDERLRIYVRDHGVGIPTGERDRLFTQFGKLSSRPTAGESSTGLGLWIAKHLTTLQGGDIGVDSPVDGGSIFWIEMPVSPVPVAN